VEACALIDKRLVRHSFMLSGFLSSLVAFLSFLSGFVLVSLDSLCNQAQSIENHHHFICFLIVTMSALCFLFLF
jgi:hypothetical protein